MSAFPPYRSVPSIPISVDIALKYLQTYLNATKSSPHLLPNARLEPSGPTVGSSNSGVTMRNLQRVEAGLRGEWLAPSLDLEDTAVPVAQGMDDATNVLEGDHMQVDGWQDLDEYQREQSIEVGLREVPVADMGDAGEPNEDRVDDEEVTVAKKSKKKHGGSDAVKRKSNLSKEQRRLEKKTRQKEEQIRRAQEKQRAKQ